MAFHGQGVKPDVIIQTADLISVVMTMFQVKKMTQRGFFIQPANNIECTLCVQTEAIFMSRLAKIL